MEDVEMILPPAEPTKPVLQEKQPEKPTPTENAAMQEMFRLMMEKMDENSKKMEEKMDENSKDCLLYTSRCV